MSIRLGSIQHGAGHELASVRLLVETPGRGFIEITQEAERFVREIGAREGVLFVYLRHTSASLVIQENADSDVRVDLITALDRLAPEDAGWVHQSEGADDMPSHVKAMLNGVSLHVPIIAGRLGLGTWQGIFVAEHRRRPHTREVVLQFLGSRAAQ
jgi:secondary thiamine-phosphate synthase enzyme